MLRYIVNELRRRLGRTLLTALGLAAGVGLVIGIIGVSQGLDNAQAEVLAPLRSIGTDILVTRVAGAQTTSNTSTPAAPSPAPSSGPQAIGPGRAGGGGGFFFGAGPGGALNQEDTSALLQENASVLTDLSKLGKAGTKFTRDFFLSGTLLSFPSEALAQVSNIEGVTSATAGLTLQVQHQTGTVPQIVANIKTGGETIKQTVRPAPMTAAEEEAFRACVERNGGGSVRPAPGSDPPGGGGGRRFAQECLPKRFQEFEASFITPLRTIQQLINPPTTDISNKSYTAAGIDPASPKAGLVTTEQLTSGTWISGANDVLVANGYASKNSLAVGSKLTINGKTFTVSGLVNPTLTGASADIYFPLATLQELAGKAGRITQVLVKVSDASDVDAVAKRISDALPGAQVVTTKSLADQVTGSLKDAKNLASRLGGALGAIVLAAAFIIAVLLTLSSIAKRVREIGTLRAIGWSKRRVVRQVLGETVGIGVLGGVLGIGLGFAAAAAVGKFSPELTATSSGVPGIGSSQLAGFFGSQAVAAKTTTLQLTAPVEPMTLVLGVAFAVVGGLLAGLVGGWRAARLAPAEALRTVG